jgi:cell division protein FtsW
LGKKVDYYLLFAALLLLCIGLTTIFSASAPYAYIYQNDPYYFVKRQLKWVGVGLVFLYIGAKINYRKYQKISKFLLFLTFGLLISVFVPGIGKEIRGVHRWIKLGGITLQPSEIAKITLVTYLACSLVQKRKKVKSFVNGFLPYFIIVGIICLLVAIEPDLGSALIVATTAFILLYAGGIKISHLIYGILLILIPSYFSISETGYQKSRIMGFLHPENDPQGIGFQPLHLKISLGSGGLWGLGPGKGKEKLFYLPAPHTDSIFAVIGEEFGFIGTSLIIALFFILALRGFIILKRAPDEEGKLLALGLTSMICLQAIVNMGVATVLLPTTGTTLPFLSYGGSSLVVSLAAIGILLNISKNYSATNSHE